MLGFGAKHSQANMAKLPVFVHAIQSAEAFALAQKIWHNNERSLVADAQNRKECLYFVFSNPNCTVWLQRDAGRTDCFELILIWDKTKEDITEVYIINTSINAPIGDGARVKSLLSAILAGPATIPAKSVT